MAARRVSIIDVARRAGVSKSTASRALLGQAAVAPRVRDAVVEAAAELGYVKDYRAHALKSAEATSIAMFVRAVRLSFYGELVAAIQSHIEAAGYQLTVTTAPSDAATEPAAIERMMGLRPAGVIFASGRVSNEVIASAARSVPVVLVGRRVRIPNVGSVVDDGAGVRELARQVVAHGHRDVAVVMPTRARSATLHHRAHRMRDALRALGVEPRLVPFAPGTDRADPDALAEAASHATAIMCPNDPVVLTTWEQLADLGRRVPDDISLTGYDGIGQLASPVIGLTTWQQPVAQIGLAAAEQLLDRVADPRSAPRHTQLAGSLLPGKTLTRRDAPRARTRRQRPRT